MIHIGSHTLPSQALLAPMAGVTDVPFRQLCQQYGAGLTTSEMLIADTELWQSQKSTQRLQTVAHQTLPNSMQIVGYDPDMLCQAAVAAVAHGAEIVDINMGCPAKKVCKRAAGSALLKDEALVAAILNRVVEAMAEHAIPVTLKIRTGWDEQSKNAVTIGKIAEQAGVQALAIHGRTRAMRFNGHAEYQTIAEVKQAISIPVIANGDIGSVEKALHILAETGVDGVMLGRGAQGRPWIFQQISQALQQQTITEPSFAEKQRVMSTHLQALHSFYGDYLGLRFARKHMVWYLQQLNMDRAISKQFNALDSLQAQLQFVAALTEPATDIAASIH